MIRFINLRGNTGMGDFKRAPGFALRPKPFDLHHLAGMPCPACDWCDRWERTKTWGYCLLAAVSWAAFFGLGWSTK